MKNEPTKTKVVLSILSVLAMGSCSMENKKQIVVYPEQGVGTVGIKNVKQMIETFYAVTRVSRQDSNISNVYSQVRGLFLTDNDARKLSAPTLMAATSLAGAFCDRFLTEEQNRTPGSRLAHNLVDFNAGYGSFTSGARYAVIIRYADLFWQRQPSSYEINLIYQTLDGIYSGIASNSAFEMRKGLLGICSVMLSSFETIKN